MDVKIESKCSRCDKTEEKTVSLNIALGLEEAEAEQEQLAEGLSAKLNDILTDAHPDIIIAYRNAGLSTSYRVRTLNNLCNSPDAKRNKGCTARVDVLIKEIFMENPPPKKSKKPTTKTPEPSKKDGKK